MADEQLATLRDFVDSELTLLSLVIKSGLKFGTDSHVRDDRERAASMRARLSAAVGSEMARRRLTDRTVAAHLVERALDELER